MTTVKSVTNGSGSVTSNNASNILQQQQTYASFRSQTSSSSQIQFLVRNAKNNQDWDFIVSGKNYNPNMNGISWGHVLGVDLTDEVVGPGSDTRFVPPPQNSKLSYFRNYNEDPYVRMYTANVSAYGTTKTLAREIEQKCILFNEIDNQLSEINEHLKTLKKISTEKSEKIGKSEKTEKTEKNSEVRNVEEMLAKKSKESKEMYTTIMTLKNDLEKAMSEIAAASVIFHHQSSENYMIILDLDMKQAQCQTSSETQLAILANSSYEKFVTELDKTNPKFTTTITEDYFSSISKTTSTTTAMQL